MLCVFPFVCCVPEINERRGGQLVIGLLFWASGLTNKESALVTPLDGSGGVMVASEREARRKQCFLQNRQNPQSMKLLANHR
jgi:hypothetical protein